MTSNQLVLASLAMDLKRAALGYHRGSFSVAKRFLEEALKRKNEVDRTKTRPYIVKLLDKVERLSKQDTERLAEETLMLSTLFQNAVFHPREVN